MDDECVDQMCSIGVGIPLGSGFGDIRAGVCSVINMPFTWRTTWPESLTGCQVFIERHLPQIIFLEMSRAPFAGSREVARVTRVRRPFNRRCDFI